MMASKEKAKVKMEGVTFARVIAGGKAGDEWLVVLMEGGGDGGGGKEGGGERRKGTASSFKANGEVTMESRVEVGEVKKSPFGDGGKVWLKINGTVEIEETVTVK